jgi:adenosylhomocysteine nucleosidase
VARSGRRVPPTAARPLVVAALREEVAHVGAGFEVLVTGVGKAVAAARLARRLADLPTPSLVVNVGTAGAVDPSVEGLVEIEVVTQHDFAYSALEELLAEPPVFGYRLTRDAAPERIEAIPIGARALATGDAFVSDVGAAALIADRGVQLVDMEAFAYAATCAAFDAPLVCVKAVSDRADAGAGESWLEAIDECARRLGAWLDRSLPTA